MTDSAAVTHLVVGYDRSPASQEAIRVAVDLATRLGAELHVLHVVDLHDFPIDPDSSDWEEQAQRTLEQERHQAEHLLAVCPGTWTYHIERGDPVRALTTLADDLHALLIVVGTRGGGLGSAVQRLLDGSVSRRLVKGHCRPVLVVPQPAGSRNRR